MALSKGDLVAAVAKSAGCTKKCAADCLESSLGASSKERSGDGSVTLTGFGTFRVSHRKARAGVNPQTGARIQISARKVPTFKAGKGLREAVR